MTPGEMLWIVLWVVVLTVFGLAHVYRLWRQRVNNPSRVAARGLAWWAVFSGGCGVILLPVFLCPAVRRDDGRHVRVASVRAGFGRITRGTSVLAQGRNGEEERLVLGRVVGLPADPIRAEWGEFAGDGGAGRLAAVRPGWVAVELSEGFGRKGEVQLFPVGRLLGWTLFSLPFPFW